MIQLSDIHVVFGQQQALEGVCLEVDRNMILGIMGPGGSGKSTLCRVISGLLRPQQGTVIVNGVDLTRTTPATMREVQTRIGVQFQNDALFEHMTVLENIQYPLTRTTTLSREEVADRSVSRLSDVGLSGFEHRTPASLSGGQRRRVALARACVTDPLLLICDDPTAGLDPVTSRQILDMITGIRQRTGSTVLVVSSDVVGLMSVSTRMALIWGGRIVETDHTDRFRQSERKEVVRFLSDARLPFEGWSWD